MNFDYELRTPTAEFDYLCTLYQWYLRFHGLIFDTWTQPGECASFSLMEAFPVASNGQKTEACV